MLPYSQKFIDSANISNYLNESDINKLLDDRIKNFKDSSFVIDYKKMISLIGIDHYVCKKIYENEPEDACVKAYLKKVQDQLSDNPFLFYSLPISKLSKDKLKIYIPKIDEIVKYLKTKGNEVYNIYQKFEANPDKLNREEKDQLIEYFYYRVGSENKEINIAQKKFIKFLLNNAKSIGYQALSLIIKYFGYKKCIEDKLYDTQIIIANTKEKGENVLGISTNRAVVISKENINYTTFKDNKLENRYGYCEYYTEGLGYLLTLFHELRHQKQKYECAANLNTSISLYQGARQIIHSINPNDYKDNYVFSEVEKDANFYGWIEVEKVIKNYMPDVHLEEALRNIQVHKYTELIEDLCAGRKKGDKKELGKFMLCKYLENAIKEKPSIITDEYKQFKQFYEDSGYPKELSELLKISMNKDNEDFYFEQIVYRTTVGNAYTNLNDLSYDQKLSIIEQISKIISLIFVKLKSIDIYKKSDFNLSIISKNEELLICENIKYYKNAATILRRLVQVSLYLYTDLSNPDEKLIKLVDNINSNLERINKIESSNKDDKIDLIKTLGGTQYGRNR